MREPATRLGAAGHQTQPPAPGHLQIVVQHDPRRADLLPRLLPDLPGAQVVADPEPNDPRRSPWRCYMACLSEIKPDASHLLIVQDDAIACRDFLPTVERVVAVQPRRIVALFVPGTVHGGANAMLEACAAGKHWAEIPRQAFVPVVAVVYPREEAIALLAYSEARPFARGRTADDANVAEWARVTQRTVWMTVPSLVEHPDDAVSLAGQVAMNGLNPARTARCWAGKEWSPSQIDWAT